MSIDNIKVAIKVRPLIKREKSYKLPSQWSVKDNRISQIDPETKKKGAEFCFDHVFDEKSTNTDVYNATVKRVVEAAMHGFNGTIFAYGQTSSGKTYTMLGTNEEPGIIPLAVTSIFDSIHQEKTREFILTVSYLEIYNEKINDLLDPSKKDLKVRYDHEEPKVDCTQSLAHSVEDVLWLMKKGDKNRRIGETNMNEKSSRSHTIFKITISSVLRDIDHEYAMIAQLNLIDLAGSERAKQTGAIGERFNEGKHINSSLSKLGLVINQLSENCEHEGRIIHKHIKFRDSILTRILEPSLGGNSLTTIICTVTPAAGGETLCTLAFAQRAKGVINKPVVNETGSEKALIKRLRRQIHELEEKLMSVSGEPKVEDVEIVRGRIELMKNKILSGGEGKIVGDRLNRTWGGGTSSGDCEGLKVDEELQEEIGDLEEGERVQGKRDRFMNVSRAVHDDSFSTDWQDFELQLIKDEEERLERWPSQISRDSGLAGFVTGAESLEERDFETSENSHLAKITDTNDSHDSSSAKSEDYERLQELLEKESEVEKYENENELLRDEIDRLKALVGDQGVKKSLKVKKKNQSGLARGWRKYWRSFVYARPRAMSSI